MATKKKKTTKKFVTKKTLTEEFLIVEEDWGVSVCGIGTMYNINISAAFNDTASIDETIKSFQTVVDILKKNKTRLIKDDRREDF